MHGPWRHTGDVSPDGTPILTKAWHKNEPNTVPWFLFKVRAGFWICCDAVVNEDESGCWDRVEVIASLGGDRLPLGRCFVPWARGQLLPLWSQGCCAASIELFELFCQTAWSSESSYLGQIERLEKMVAALKEEKKSWAEEREQLELQLHLVQMEALAWCRHAWLACYLLACCLLASSLHGCMFACMCACFFCIRQMT